MRLLRYLHDFRTLPFFVLFSMAVGIGIGKAFGISDYELTPPIDAIKDIFRGRYDFTIGNTLALGVVAGLFLMIYPAMTNIRVDDLGAATRSPKQLLIVAFANYAIAPFFMFALAEVFLRGDEDLHTGLVLYGIAPCIAMVIVFTFLALGNTPLALVLVAFNSVAQMILLPVYAKILIGNVDFDVLVVGESVVLYLGLPLVLGLLTRRAGVARLGEAGFERFREGLNTLSVVGLLFTLVVMFGLKGDLIVNDPMIVLRMAVPMTIFFFVMFNAVYVAGWRLGFNYEDAVAVAFNSTGRDFEIAIAIAITAFSPAVAVATEVGPLIEVPVMLSLVWIAMRSGQRLFAAPVAPLEAALVPSDGPGGAGGERRGAASSAPTWSERPRPM